MTGMEKRKPEKVMKMDMGENLLEKLQKYGATDAYPLHMPGHKRRISHFSQPFDIDITEIEGFDNLFHAEEILREAQERAALLYGAEESFYLVNGSTCGILAAISASVPRNGRILMARNCHKAAYHGILLNGIHAEYLYPPADMVRGMNGCISVEMVKEKLSGQLSDSIDKDLPQQKMSRTDEYLSVKTTESKNRSFPGNADRISAVLLTSPAYDGVVSDIRAIAEVVHQAGAILIVDEAHGAHFAMHDGFPKSAVACGADLVINSLHKTLPSLTQTALLHVQGNRVDRDRLRKYLGVYQSSSPSYVFMAGMDACICMMLKEKEQLYDTFQKRLKQMREKLERMKYLHLIDGHEPELQAFDFDRSKVLISTENCSLSGPDLAEILRKKYQMEPEMESEQYVTAIMTVADTEEGFLRLTEALLETDRELSEADRELHDMTESRFTYWKNETVLTITEADELPKEQISLERCEGCIAAEFVYRYPPGIPLLVPGEQIPEGFCKQIKKDMAIGLHIQGLADYSGETIYVVRV